MAYTGASRGNTAAEMAKTLHLPDSREQLNHEIDGLQTAWNSNDTRNGIRLHAANRLWGQTGKSFLPEFPPAVAAHWRELGELDFAADPEKARQIINQWVLDHTENKIVNLIPSASLLQHSVLVLTNAVYFTRTWTDPFSKLSTKDEDFRVSAQKKVKVPMMHQKHTFGYAAADGVQAFGPSLRRLEHFDDRAPAAEADGLPKLEAAAQRLTAAKMGAGDETATGDRRVPRFKITAANSS